VAASMLSGWIFVLYAAAKSPQSFLGERFQYISSLFPGKFSFQRAQTLATSLDYQ
jgi:hypothetical protein